MAAEFYEMKHGLKPMSDEDAGCIVDAFLQYVDGVSQIIVHCDAGYSRSPAVAAALAKALGEAENPKIVAESCERHSMRV